MNIRVKVIDATTQWRKRLDSFTPNMLRRGSLRVRKHLQEWWLKKDRNEPNKLNPVRRTHFWRTIKESLKEVRTFRAQGRTEIVSHDYRLGHKITGGTIRPKNVKALTIPIHPSAYGVRASFLAIAEGVRLFVLKQRNGNAFLAGKKDGTLIRYYLLRYEVTQAPWPRTMPTPRTIRDQFIKGATEPNAIP